MPLLFLSEGEMMLDQITYNRQEKRYEFVEPNTGELFTEPSGKTNKMKLFQKVVGMLEPDLYLAATELTVKHLHLTRTVWAAVQIVVSGGVTIMSQGHLLALVQGSDGLPYSITSYDDYTFCECESFKGLHAPLIESGQRICKHIAAMSLTAKCRPTDTTPY